MPKAGSRGGAPLRLPERASQRGICKNWRFPSPFALWDVLEEWGD